MLSLVTESALRVEDSVNLAERLANLPGRTRLPVLGTVSCAVLLQQTSGT
jgi:hypothetical protein